METFGEIRGSATNLIAKELQDSDSVNLQMTIWVRFRAEVDCEHGSVMQINTVNKVFNGRMMEVFQRSDLGEIIEEMLTFMRTQVKNVTENSRFVFDRVIFLDVNFHQLNLTRGRSYLPPPDWISNKKAVINQKDEEDEECFKWTVLAALLHHEVIGKDPPRILKLRRFEGGYDWRGLGFPLPLNKIDVFKRNNNVSVNVLAIGRGKEKLYILRKATFSD